MDAAKITPDQLPHFADGLDPTAQSWDWEAFRVRGKLYLYCYLRETVLIPLASDTEA